MEDKREESIRARAKQIWEQEGQPQGRDEEIWYRAAEEVDSGQVPSAEAPHGDRQVQPPL